MTPKQYLKYLEWLDNDLNRYINEYVLQQIPELGYGGVDLMGGSRSTVRRIPSYYGNKFSKNIDIEISRLPDEQKNLLLVTLLNRASQKDLAKVFKCSERTIRYRLARAKKTLINALYIYRT